MKQAEIIVDSEFKKDLEEEEKKSSHTSEESEDHDHNNETQMARINHRETWKAFFRCANVRDPDRPISEKELKNPYS